MASEDVFDQLSRTNKRRKKSTKRAKAPKITYELSDSDDYSYPGAYNMEDNEDDGYQDEIEYGNNKLILDEETNYNDDDEDDDKYYSSRTKHQWTAFQEENDDEPSEEDIYSLGLIARDSQSVRNSDSFAPGSSSTSRSLNNGSTRPDSEEDTHLSQSNSTQGRRNKRRRSQLDGVYDYYDLLSDEEDEDEDESVSHRALNNDDSLRVQRQRRRKIRAFPSVSSESENPVVLSLVDSYESSPSTSSAAVERNVPSSSANTFAHSSRFNNVIYNLESSSDESSEYHSSMSQQQPPQRNSSDHDRLPNKITERVRRRSTQTPSTQTSSPILRSSAVQSSYESDNSRPYAWNNFDQVFDCTSSEEDKQSSPEPEYLTDSPESSEYPDSMDGDDREYELGDVFRRRSMFETANTANIPTMSINALASILPSIMPARNNRRRSIYRPESDRDEDIDDEELARRLQEEELAPLRYPLATLGSDALPLRRRSPNSDLETATRMSSSATVNRNRSRRQPPQALSLFGEFDDFNSQHDDDEETGEENLWRAMHTLRNLHVIFADASSGARPRRGPLTERHDLSGIYSSLNMLEGITSVATNPMNYMADDELDTSYEGLWRLSEEIGYERSRGLSADARTKMKTVTWRQFCRTKNMNETHQETSKGKQKASKQTSILESRSLVRYFSNVPRMSIQDT
ncbi:hypothetical protein INT43_004082 [Umbelopsis isabellina]|uniref:Uncharacterized protein n=1 Tax=Mortierella isabellina TaxID=91625 RepID=A0A8H7UHR1_MORIS|nr:hypothetical protein INT43_004082 [Umbelopsis isabellina]